MVLSEKFVQYSWKPQHLETGTLNSVKFYELFNPRIALGVKSPPARFCIIKNFGPELGLAVLWLFAECELDTGCNSQIVDRCTGNY